MEEHELRQFAVHSTTTVVYWFHACDLFRAPAALSQGGAVGSSHVVPGSERDLQALELVDGVEGGRPASGEL